MPNLYTIPAGIPMADCAARHILATLGTGELGRAVILLPSRRSCTVLRQAFLKQLAGKAALLPRMLPLADGEDALLSLLGERALPLLASIPPAMDESEQRYVLAEQIRVFERKRIGGGVTLEYALTLADTLIALQEQCIRHHVELTQEKLRALVHADFATHWKEALLFLGILTDSWPAIEQALGLTTAAAREVALTQALAQSWAETPPDMPVFAIGSTGSQPATAQLLKTIADVPTGQVILPGLDPTIRNESWQAIRAGHPLFHLKALLDQWPIEPAAVKTLSDPAPTPWLEALAPTAEIPQWQGRATPPHRNLRLIPCAHAEEEARTISLLLRESLESPTDRVALITPDEHFMARVAAHMKRYGIIADRLSSGTLATTATGSLWNALMAAITNPERLLSLRSLLHHPLMAVEPALLDGLEPGWHGVNRLRAGGLPHHAPALRDHPQYTEALNLARQIHLLSGQHTSASAWLTSCRAMLEPWVKPGGQGSSIVEETLSHLNNADHFGPLDAEDFAALLQERLNAKWRDAGIHHEPRITMLTPVEARLEHFDRTILANMQETVWPGAVSPNPWLNLAAQTALGLPSPEENISLMAHDMLMLGSGPDVILTYPGRDQGAPTTRSRFIERLATLLAAHHIPESEWTDKTPITLANLRDASTLYAPEEAARPSPPKEQRPTRLPITDLDKLFTDPFTLYAKHVLNLRELKEIDASPEASDFGNLAHKAIEALTTHWNHESRAATAAELGHIANHALRDFSERPNIALFWRTRLLGALRYVNHLESERRPRSVMTEEPIEGVMAGITLHGRMDRLEDKNGKRTAIDYKTGTVPSEKKIREGQALQLLAYAMLLENAEAIEYWQMPKLGEVGEVLSIATPPEMLGDLHKKLTAALEQLQQSTTPFLATHHEERFENPYDGISRYDEWAG